MAETVKARDLKPGDRNLYEDGSLAYTVLEVDVPDPVHNMGASRVWAKVKYRDGGEGLRSWDSGDLDVPNIERS